VHVLPRRAGEPQADPAHLTRFYLMISSRAVGAVLWRSSRRCAVGLLRARRRACVLALLISAAWRRGLLGGIAWRGHRWCWYRAAQEYSDGVR